MGGETRAPRRLSPRPRSGGHSLSDLRFEQALGDRSCPLLSVVCPPVADPARTGAWSHPVADLLERLPDHRNRGAGTTVAQMGCRAAFPAWRAGPARTWTRGEALVAQAGAGAGRVDEEGDPVAIVQAGGGVGEPD